MKTNDPWAEILKEALDRGVASGEAIAGARFRDLVVSVALEKGYSYPPRDEPHLKFGQFLERHANIVIVLHRPGQDLLVAPANDPSILIEAYGRIGIRKDIFDAFTRIDSDHVRWYDPTTDTVVRRPKLAAELGSPFVKIPSPTLDDALLFRQQFAATQEDPTVRERLNSSLQARSLASFTVEIREIGLRRQWHLFRIKELANRLARWAQEVHVPWSDSWLDALPARGGLDEVNDNVATIDQESTTISDDFAALLQTLSSDDLARITVPLDLVLKALRKRS